MKSFIKKMMQKHMIRCPKCNNDLYFDALAKEVYYLKCIDCNVYYEWQPKTKKIKISETHVKSIEILKKKGLSDADKTAKLPTSTFFKPKWVKIIEKIFHI